MPNNNKNTSPLTLQEYIDINYPKSGRENVTKLDASNKLLAQGDGVDLSDFVELTQVPLDGNQLTDIYFLKSIKNKEKLSWFFFHGNKIVDPDFQFIGDNFPNASILSFKNNPIDKNISFKGLQNCKSLHIMDIGNINEEVVYRDMDFLPPTLYSYYNVRVFL